MSSAAQRWSATLVVIASLLGLAFSSVSALDYVNHLDRQVHDISCSFIPGVTVKQGADEGCRAAMYSPYSALFRHDLWGGVPIALFAVGAFAFFAAFGLYLLLAHRSAPRRAGQFIALAGITPLVASIVMAVIAATKLGQFCKTCIGMYAASALLAVGAVAAWWQQRRELDLRSIAAARAARVVPPKGAAGEDDDASKGDGVEGEAAPKPAGRRDNGPPARRSGGWALIPAWFAALGAFALAPALVYAKSAPRYDHYINNCGALLSPPKTPKDFPRITPRGAKVQATIVVDPLCPTCKALHQRLDSDGYLDQLDATLVMFPLDDACNWMVDQSVHPGACELSKAVLCAEHRAGDVLTWIYDNQERLAEAGKAQAGLQSIQAAIRDRWPELVACTKDKETGRRLDRVLRFAVDNRLQVSTPQLFVSGKRLCDEDSDLGLDYALPRLAPELKKP
jgi:uncharacterized membrane protein